MFTLLAAVVVVWRLFENQAESCVGSVQIDGTDDDTNAVCGLVTAANANAQVKNAIGARLHTLCYAKARLARSQKTALRPARAPPDVESHSGWQTHC